MGDTTAERAQDNHSYAYEVVSSYLATAKDVARREFDAIGTKAQEIFYKVIPDPSLARGEISNEIMSTSRDKINDSLEEEFYLVPREVTKKRSTLDLLRSGSLYDLIGKIKDMGITEVNDHNDIVKLCKDQYALVGDVRKSAMEMRVDHLYKTVFPDAFDFFNNAFDAALHALGYYEIGYESSNRGDARSKYEVYMAILGVPSVVFLTLTQVALLPYEIAIAGTIAIVAAAALTITGYVSYVKPCPTWVYGFENLTYYLRKGWIESQFGRRIEIEDILTKMLQGKGVVVKEGTPELFQEMAKLIATGDLPPELAKFKGKKVFFESMPYMDLKERNDPVQQIYSKLRGYGKDAIVIFYERPIDLEVIELEKLSGKAVMQVRTPDEVFYRMRDIGFTNCIYSTLSPVDKTSEIPVTEIKPMDRDNTRLVLMQFLKKFDSTIDLEEDIIDYLLDQIEEKCGNGFDPRLAKSVLEEAINQLFQDPLGCKKLLIDLNNLKQMHKDSFRNAKSTQQNIGYSHEYLTNLENEIEKYQLIQQRQEREINRLKKVRSLWKEKKEELFDLAKQVVNNPKSEYLQKQWIILNYFVLPFLEKKIWEIRASEDLQGVATTVGQKLIEKALRSKFPDTVVWKEEEFYSTEENNVEPEEVFDLT